MTRVMVFLVAEGWHRSVQSRWLAAALPTLAASYQAVCDCFEGLREAFSCTRSHCSSAFCPLNCPLIGFSRDKLTRSYCRSIRASLSPYHQWKKLLMNGTKFYLISILLLGLSSPLCVLCLKWWHHAQCHPVWQVFRDDFLSRKLPELFHLGLCWLLPPFLHPAHKHEWCSLRVKCLFMQHVVAKTRCLESEWLDL